MTQSNNEIKSFTLGAGHGFLSNYHPSTIYIDKRPYPTVEHAYQASKTMDENARELIRKAPGPKEAKKLGRCLQLREDWEEIKITLMKDFLKQKFESPFLADQLIKTGSAKLINENTWNDKFWGVCRGSGQNWLGKLLMEIREHLRLDLEQI